MADQSDVETVLAGIVSTALYPDGTTAPSLLSTTCRIYRGWPSSAALDADLTAGIVNVTIYPDPTHQQLTTRYPDNVTVTTANVPTLTITVSGTSATIGGTAAPSQVAGLLVDTMAVVHRLEAGDTPDTVAAVLATYLRTQRIVTVSGATVTIPGAGLIVGRVVADQQGLREVRRQSQGFRISCWCPSPTTRDACASAIDATFAAMRFIDLPDGTQGHLTFRSSLVFDQSQDAKLWRRDLLYAVDYATTLVSTQPAMIFGCTGLSPGNSGVVQSLLG
jgi:hypothetical protein